MAMTLAQADLLTLPKLVSGVIETIIEENGEVLDRLPFVQFEGENLTYIRESTLPTAAFYDVNEVITESSPTHAEVTVTAKKIISDSDLDKFLRDSKSDHISMEAEYIRAAAKNVARKWYDRFFYGDNTTNTKEFSGVHRLCSTATPDQSLEMGGNAVVAALSLAKLDELIDAVKPGKPDVLFMNKNIRRRLSQSLRATSVAGYISFGVDEFGRRAMFYDNIPIIVSDWLTQTEPVTGNPAGINLAVAGGDYSAGGTGSSIIAVKFGSPAEGGLFGIQTNSMAEVERIDPVPNKDSIRYRVKWYVGMGLGNLYSVARLSAISDAAVVV